MLLGRGPSPPSSPDGLEKAFRPRLIHNQLSERPQTVGTMGRQGSKTLPTVFNGLILAVQKAQEECHRGFENKRPGDEIAGTLSVPFLSGSDIRAALKHGATVIQKTSNGYTMFPWTAVCNSAQQLRQVPVAALNQPHTALTVLLWSRLRTALWRSSPSCTRASSSSSHRRRRSAGACRLCAGASVAIAADAAANPSARQGGGGGGGGGGGMRGAAAA